MSDSYPNSLNYVCEKLGVAVYNMAVGTGSIQDRVHSGYMSFHTLSPKDFPDGELRTRYESIHDRLTALTEPPEHGNRLGKVRYTLNHMSEEDAVELAKDIYNLDFFVDLHREDLEKRSAK